jgi:hypothetical protein
MTEYALLVHPGQNRAYFDETRALLLSEFRAVASAHPAGAGGAEMRDIGGAPCIVFNCGQPLEPGDLPPFERLSSFYALFELKRDGGRTALLPLEPPARRYFPDSMGALLKYSGKTNERFTRMMLNLARSCCRTGTTGPLRVLDPMCGKGTTLWEALTDGCHASGVEINAAWWQEAKTFLVRFMETGRYKHKASAETVRGAGGRKAADVFVLEAANGKAAWEAGDTRSVRLVCGDTRQAASFFPKESFDLLAADLPYGVQHAGRQGKGKEPSGDLAGLLDESLPGWHKLMKSGGAAALSFNVFTLKRADVEALLEKHGFEVMREEPYTGFSHRVDQGIRRDLVVARV